MSMGGAPAGPAGTGNKLSGDILMIYSHIDFIALIQCVCLSFQVRQRLLKTWVAVWGNMWLFSTVQTRWTTEDWDASIKVSECV